MIGDPAAAEALEKVARLIQQSLTPIFLLSALGSLLSVFAARLARVADRVDQLTTLLDAASPRENALLEVELAYQRRRTRALDHAVVLGTVGGALTCASVLVLFVGALGDWDLATVLFGLFGAAVVAAIGALAAFGHEMLLASHGVRRRSRSG